MPLAGLRLFGETGASNLAVTAKTVAGKCRGNDMAFDITEYPEKSLLVIEHWESADNAAVVEASIKMGARVVDPVFKRILIDVRKSVVEFDLDALVENNRDFMALISDDAKVAYAMHPERHRDEAAAIRGVAERESFALCIEFNREAALGWLMDQSVD